MLPKLEVDSPIYLDTYFGSDSDRKRGREPESFRLEIFSGANGI